MENRHIIAILLIAIIVLIGAAWIHAAYRSWRREAKVHQETRIRKRKRSSGGGEQP